MILTSGLPGAHWPRKERHLAWVPIARKANPGREVTGGAVTVEGGQAWRAWLPRAGCEFRRNRKKIGRVRALKPREPYDYGEQWGAMVGPESSGFGGFRKINVTALNWIK